MSYVATVQNALRNDYPSNYDKLERRPTEAGGLEIFRKQSLNPSNFISPYAAGLIEDSYGAAAEVNHPVLNARTVTIGNTISCALPAASDGDAALIVTAAPVTYTFGFTMVKDQHIKNDIPYTAALMEKLMAYDLQMQKDMDVDALGVIEAAINQHFPASIGAYYSQTANALQVAQANKDDFYNKLSAILGEMDFSGNADILANRVHQPMVNRFINQGAGNSENQAFQFQGFQYFFDNSDRLTNNVSVESTIYAIKAGSLFSKDRIPSAYKGEGTYLGDRRSPIKAKHTMVMPVTGTEMAVLYQQDCSDQSSLGIGEANAASFVEGWTFFVQKFYLSVYNSAPSTRFTPILKAEILA